MSNLSRATLAIVAAIGVAILSGSAFAQIGSTPRGPSQSDFDNCNREAQVARGGSAGSALPSGSEGTTGAGSAAGATGGTGSVSGGSTLQSAQADPFFQQAYRECLRRRGF